MKSDIYRTGYSLDSLRDIAEQMRGRMDEAGDSTYLADTLRRLDDLVFNGYPKTDEDFKGVGWRGSRQRGVHGSAAQGAHLRPGTNRADRTCHAPRQRDVAHYRSDERYQDG